MAVLLWAGVCSWSHWRATHRATRASRRHHGGTVGAHLPCLLTRQPAAKVGHDLGCLAADGAGIGNVVDVVSDNDDAVLAIIVAKLHPASAKLTSRVRIELDDRCGTGWFGTAIGKLLQHLLERETERLELLLLHPDNVRLTFYDRQQPKSPLSRLADGLDLQSLCFEVGTGSELQRLLHSRSL